MMQRHEIQSTIKGLLQSTLPSIPVFIDDGSSEITNAMLGALGAGESGTPSGVCLALTPILTSEQVDYARGALMERCSLSIHLRENPDLMPVPHDETVTAVLRALMAANEDKVLDELEFGPEVTRYVIEDIGSHTTAINFSVLILTEL